VANAGGGSIRAAISLLENTFQYVDGLGSKKGTKDLAELVEANVLKGTSEDEDILAIKILASIYKGSPGGVHRSVAESENLFALSNKLLQLNLYAIDTLFIKGPNRNVWHTPLNKKFVALLRDKLDVLDEEHTNFLYGVQDALNDLRLRLSSFMLPDRALMTATLALLALQSKTSGKK